VLLLILFFQIKGNLASHRWLLYLGILCVPLGYVSQQAGWVLAEVGRQPWAIYGLLPVKVANSNLTSGTVMTTFFLFLGIFTLLLIAEISILAKQINIGPEEN
ncbi:MAG: cytochrome ubiquinol oxidase subunit I, partial [Proteobacteria bacterium]|nr:cytochrome ubiquinol oxidase subunit I [Pseudomonadota bacterium]